MALIHWPSLDEIDRMRQEIGQIVEDPSLLRWPASSDRGASLPDLDIYETAEHVVIQVSLPGVRPEAIQVVVEQHTVIIEGEVQPDRHVRQEHYRRERRLGKFARSVPAPAYADMDHAEACFEDGMLTITLPKLARATTRTIPAET